MSIQSTDRFPRRNADGTWDGDVSIDELATAVGTKFAAVVLGQVPQLVPLAKVVEQSGMFLSGTKLITPTSLAAPGQQWTANPGLWVPEFTVGQFGIFGWLTTISSLDGQQQMSVGVLNKTNIAPGHYTGVDLEQEVTATTGDDLTFDAETGNVTSAAGGGYGVELTAVFFITPDFGG